MTHDELIIQMVRRMGRTVKDMELFNGTFFLTIYGGELKLIYRARPLE